MTHRHKVEQWGITFPKSQGIADKATFASTFPPRKYSVVCEEVHEDGSPHLHAALKLRQGITHSTMINWVKKRFPNDWKRIKCEGIKNWDQWHDYCHKEDPDTITEGTLEDTDIRAKKIKALKDKFIDFIGPDLYQRYLNDQASYNKWKQDVENEKLWKEGKW